MKIFEKMLAMSLALCLLCCHSTDEQQGHNYYLLHNLTFLFIFGAKIQNNS